MAAFRTSVGVLIRGMVGFIPETTPEQKGTVPSDTGNVAEVPIQSMQVCSGKSRYFQTINSRS
jgi:hypothetical protein